MANLGGGKGSVQGGIRPVVVISNGLNNKFSPTVNVLPITSKTKTKIPVHVDIGIECGLEVESIVLTEQMLTINKFQLTNLIGFCTKDVLTKIAKAIVMQTEIAKDLAVI